MTKQIQDAYIVAAVRTPVGKAPRGVFRNTRPDDMLAFAVNAALSRCPSVDKSRIDDAAPRDCRLSRWRPTASGSARPT